MTDKLGIGIIGCGNISAAYFTLAPLFKGLEVRACADINTAAAEARAKEFGVKAQPIDALLANGDVDVVINLTIPDAHYAVSQRARGRQARLFGKALRADGRGGAHLKALRRRQGPAGRLGAGHLPRRRAPVRPQADRRRRGRHGHRRHRLRDEPRHGELASEPGLLLPAGRRAGARRRALLCRRPDQPDRPGEARRGADHTPPRRPAPSRPRDRARARRSRSRRRPTCTRCSNSSAARR